jgi:hypothetical protein
VVGREILAETQEIAAIPAVVRNWGLEGIQRKGIAWP